jgi:hypothetical protein
MADRDKLHNMLDNIIDNKGEQAQVNFHDYLNDKMREVVMGVDPTNTNTEKGDEE